MTLDALHTALIAGCLSTLTGLVVHAVTRWRLSAAFVMRSQCDMLRRECALADIAKIKSDLAAIREDVVEIQQIQRQRSVDLQFARDRQERIWRIVLSKLEVPTEIQNGLLLGDDPTNHRTGMS